MKECEYLRRLFDNGILTALNYHFGLFVNSLCSGSSPYMGLLAALVSKSNENGDICLSFSAVNKLCDDLPLTKGEEWKSVAIASGLCGTENQYANSLFVITSKDRIYLQRFWSYEKRLASCVKERLSRKMAVCPIKLDALTDDFQKKAAEAVLQNNLTIITGGPGTGKTTTVSKILALLLSIYGKAFKINVVAPTGKAASRSQESIEAAVKGGQLSAFDEEIKKQLLDINCQTIHRLLGATRLGTKFSRNSDNQIDCDIVIVDESSMVDIALMTALFEATPINARIVLLGDSDQLSSVEAGAVFGELCAAFDSAHVIHLRHSYRFGAGMEINNVLDAIRKGDGFMCKTLLTNGSGSSVQLKWSSAEGDTVNLIEQELEKGWSDYIEVLGISGDNLNEAFQKFSHFRLLCASWHGTFGVIHANRLAEKWFCRKVNLSINKLFTSHYRGQPVMITENSYDMNLYNGDVGLFVNEEDIFFTDKNSGDGFRIINVRRLPSFVTAYAITIHKSQGSEFNASAILLGKEDTPLLTRELIYTALSRSRESATVFADYAIINSAIMRPTRKESGLKEAICGQAKP